MNKYKSKDNYVLYEIADETMLFGSKEGRIDHESVIVFNESGAFIWKELMKDGCTIESIAEKLSNKYKLDITAAIADVYAYVHKCINEGLIDEMQEGDCYVTI